MNVSEFEAEFQANIEVNELADLAAAEAEEELAAAEAKELAAAANLAAAEVAAAFLLALDPGEQGDAAEKQANEQQVNDVQVSDEQGETRVKMQKKTNPCVAVFEFQSGDT